ncbi:MAG: alpha/beta hydrolase [Gemmatimonadota bacterium]
MPTAAQHLEAHRAAGRRFETAGVASFVREEGSGPPVVCLHGVPTSSYLYRKVVPELAARGLRGIAFDFPGMGLADRPGGDFDYSWTGLGRWTLAALDALGLDRFHLVVHDIGGPVGFEVVARAPDRIRSLTILNTLLVGLEGFRKPWVMRPFEWRGVGEAYLATLSGFLFTRVVWFLGVNDRAAAPPEELAVHVDLLRRGDGGRAFLRIMRSFETTPEKEELYVRAVRDLDVPVQFVWGEDDPALPLLKYGVPAQRVTGVDRLHRVSSKHFLQEDRAAAVAEHVAHQVRHAEGLSAEP